MGEQPPAVIASPNFTFESSTRIFIRTDFRGFFAEAARGVADVPAVPVIAPSTFTSQEPMVGIEGDGVRMPDQQFSLP